MTHIWRRAPSCVFNPLVDPTMKFLLDFPSTGRLADFGELWSGGRLARKIPVSVPFSFSGVQARDIRPFHVCSRGLRTFAAGTVTFDRAPRRALLAKQKIVFQDLRYTTHPDRLVAAQAGPGLYPVSTASMFVPHEEDRAAYFEALLNSAFANAWYKVRDISRSIKLLYLQEFPIEYDPAIWRTVATLARRCRQIRSIYHRRLPRCTVWREEDFLPERFPELYKELADHNRRIDEAIFKLYGLSGTQKRVASKLSSARAF